MGKWFAIFFVVAVVLFIFVAVATKAGAPDSPPFVPGELLVKYRDASPAIAAAHTHSARSLGYRFAVQESDVIPDGRLKKLRLGQGVPVLQAAAEYSKSPDVEYAEPNYLLFSTVVPNDASFSTQQDEFARIAAEHAWNLTRGASSVVIAVIDSGVEWNHSDLAANIWNNTDELLNSADADNNGYADDVRGYDFTDIVNSSYTPVYNLLAGEDYNDIDNDPMDTFGHGTHVAGIIAAVTNNSVGVAGACWNCTIMAVRAGFRAQKIADGKTYGLLETDDIALALHYAADNNATIISMSFGGGASNTLQEAIRYANHSILVASAGNDNTNSESYPAAYPEVIAVAATDNNDAKASFSNYGGWVAIAAPGVSVYSTYAGNTYAASSGTSMAAPLVSGVIALMRSWNSTLNSTQALAVLNSTGKVLTDFGSSGLNVTLINASAALTAIDRTPPNVSFISPTLPDNSVLNSSFLTVNITANESLTSAFFEWNLSANYTMNGSLAGWFRFNHSNLTNGNNTYRVFANDSNGNMGVSLAYSLFVNNTAPNITSFFPNTTAFNITEPANQTFNVSYDDVNSDAVAIAWFQNGTAVGSGINFTFIGNFTAAALYNITALVSDGSLSAVLQWNFTVNNSNRAPVLTLPQNFTLPEDTNLTINLSAADLDNDTLTYSVNNTANFSINSTRGNITYNATSDFYGEFWLSATVSDGEENASAVFFVNITPVNDAPLLMLPPNVVVNESLWANFTVNATDVDNLSVNFSTNDSRFALAVSNFSANFSWLTTVNDSGTYSLQINATDGNLTATAFLNITVLDLFDSDADGIPDLYDDDDDNDGIPDDEDFLVGNSTFVNTTVAGMSITVNATANLTQRFNGTFTINITNTTRSIVVFPWNFSNGTLNLANLSVIVQPAGSPNGSLLVRGLHLQGNTTKNVTVDRINGSDSVCVKDADIDRIDSISFSCNAANETFLSCPGASGQYTCSLAANGALYFVAGLRFSGVREQCADSDGDGFSVSGCGNGNDCNDNDASKTTDCSSSSSSSSSGGGGGGGGGGTPAAVNRVSRFYTTLVTGERVEVPVAKESLAVTSIAFTAAAALSSVTVTVQAVSASAVMLPLANAYQYLEISMDTGNENLNAVAISFDVNRSWVESGGYDSEDVVLNRLVNTRWFALPTRFTGETAAAYSYEASTPGLSVFAITAERKAVLSSDATPSVNDTKPAENSTASQPAASFPVAEAPPRSRTRTLALEAFLAVIAIVAFLYHRHRRKK